MSCFWFFDSKKTGVQKVAKKQDPKYEAIKMYLLSEPSGPSNQKGFTCPGIHSIDL